MGKKAMGRSMAAIFGDHAVLDSDNDKVRDESVQDIPLSALEINPFQPRQVFDPEEIQQLANSLKQQGLLTPILVRKHGQGYQIVAGERRARAAKELGWSTIKAGVFERLSDKKMMEWALIENIQRVQLSPIEEAQAFELLLSVHGYTHDELAQTMGKSRSSVTNTLRLLRLPEQVQTWIRSGDLSAGHARNLLRPDVADPEALAKQIIDGGLSVREVERRTSSTKPQSPPEKAKPDANTLSLEEEFRYASGCQVKITPKGKGGSVSFLYVDDADLHRLLEQLRASENHSFGS